MFSDEEEDQIQVIPIIKPFIPDMLHGLPGDFGYLAGDDDLRVLRQAARENWDDKWPGGVRTLPLWSTGTRWNAGHVLPVIWIVEVQIANDAATVGADHTVVFR
jgi:hypothetical protein